MACGGRLGPSLLEGWPARTMLSPRIVGWIPVIRWLCSGGVQGRSWEVSS